MTVDFGGFLRNTSMGCSPTNNSRQLAIFQLISTFGQPKLLYISSGAIYIVTKCLIFKKMNDQFLILISTTGEDGGTSKRKEAEQHKWLSLECYDDHKYLQLASIPLQGLNRHHTDNDSRSYCQFRVFHWHHFASCEFIRLAKSTLEKY